MVNNVTDVALNSAGRTQGSVEWCERFRLDPDAMVTKVLNEDPVSVRFLSLANNRNAIPVLLRALQSRNWFVRVSAAEGLATFGRLAGLFDRIAIGFALIGLAWVGINFLASLGPTLTE